MSEPLNIRKIMEELLAGRMRVPNFQRGFVWDPERDSSRVVRRRTTRATSPMIRIRPLTPDSRAASTKLCYPSL